MIEFPISLIALNPGEKRGAVAAWLLPGGDPNEWGRVLCEAGWESRPFYLVPRAPDSREPAGIFVPVPPRAELGIPPRRALPYALSGKRLYHPATSRLRFALTAEEFASLFLQDVSVLHPGIGLIGFDASDAKKLGDLLRLPLAPPRDWSKAWPDPPGLPDNLVLTAISPPMSPSAIFQESRDDIGSKPVKDLPAAPGEPKSGTGDGMRKTGESIFLKAVQGFTRMFPATASQQTWVNRLDDWAQHRLDELTDRQKKEIDRLLNLLASDPDRGLRFALPLAGGGGIRGLSAPGAQLPERRVDFDLGKLGGGNEAAPWRLEAEQMQRLMKGYREAANRELHLGRYRRAAYILGHLLDDYDSAANALKQGGFYREAATLYREKMNNHAAAALCLKEGGLFEEAIALYETLGDPETAGDLHRQLGHEKEAREAWERAVQKALASNADFHVAARILESKMEEPDRALGVLRYAWKFSNQREACLVEFFQLHQRLDRHEEALAAVGEFRDLPHDANARLAIARVLGKVSRFYPQREVVDASQDAVRVLVGRSLAMPMEADKGEALHILRELDPSDHLLARDTRRFAGARKNPAPYNPPEIASGAWRMEKIDQDTVIKDFTMRGAVDLGDSFVATGSWRGRIVAMRYSPSAFQQYGYGEEGKIWRPHVLVPSPDKETRLVYMLSGGALPILLIQSDSSLHLLLRPEDANIRARTSDELGGIWSIKLLANSVVLERMEMEHKLTHTHHLTAYPPGLDFEQVSAATDPLTMAATGKYLGFAFANYLGIYDGRAHSWFEAPGQIRQVIGASSHSRPRVVFCMDEGAGMLLPDRMRSGITVFAKDAYEPVIAFTRSGHLIVACRNLIHAYNCDDDQVKLASTLASPGRPVAVLPGPKAMQFYVLSETQIFTYELKGA